MALSCDSSRVLVRGGDLVTVCFIIRWYAMFNYTGGQPSSESDKKFWQLNSDWYFEDWPCQLSGQDRSPDLPPLWLVWGCISLIELHLDLRSDCLWLETAESINSTNISDKQFVNICLFPLFCCCQPGTCDPAQVPGIFRGKRWLCLVPPAG